jgi:hypothetical protein
MSCEANLQLLCDVESMPPVSNLYSGQSLAGLNYMWQTTPAHIVAGL